MTRSRMVWLCAVVMAAPWMAACGSTSSNAPSGDAGGSTGADASSTISNDAGATSTDAGALSSDAGTTCSSYDASVQFCDSRDGRLYGYVTIGSQVWMAENLDYGTQVSASQAQSTTEKYCYDDTASECTTLGGLYQWPTAMGLDAGALTSLVSLSGTLRGLCPEGWHIPSRTEWNTLSSTAAAGCDGGFTDSDDGGKTCGAGYFLKSDGTKLAGWDNTLGAGCGIDAYGWTGLPGGARYPAGWTCETNKGALSDAGYCWGPEITSSTVPKGFRGMWWTPTQDDAGTSAAYAQLGDDNWVLNVTLEATDGGSKSHGLSVRCIKD